ncbi:hypothetical protein AVEN_110996-1 [Araneus ventricosus]|uniref:Tc1-like transposase DDE domain-containing protein n=1 Tax=Araneus ventricosus TaxID=182803 RepID=A0A4Y2HPF7_ARAVE|nr:hypothetical protein AVEN_110996-1 [Araneus ventricosus]
MITWWCISDGMGSGLFQQSDIPGLTQSRKQSENYQETLASHLLPFFEFGGTDLTFQHGNPSIHASKSVSQWLSSNMGLHRKRVE